MHNRPDRFIVSLLKRLPVLILAGLLIMPPFIAGAQDAGTLEVSILNTDAENFPEIALDVLVRDLGRPLAGLSASSFTLDEPNTNLTVEPLNARALALAVVVDLNSGSDADLIRDSLYAYFTNNYREGDRVAFIVASGPNATQVETFTTLNAILSRINALEESTANFDVRASLESALTYLQGDRDRNRTDTQQALLVGSYLYAGVNAVATRFGEARIPLHVVMAHRGRDGQNTINDSPEDTTNAIKPPNVALLGGGFYANNAEGTLVSGTGEEAEPFGDLLSLYDAINNGRLTYRLTYTTRSTSLEATRTVTLTVNSISGLRAQASGRYQPQFQDPALALVNFNPNPEISADAAGNLVIPASEIGVQVTFLDGIARDLREIRLEASSATAGTVRATFNASQWRRENDVYFIPWDLSGYNQRGQTVAVTLAVTVTDSIGRSGVVSTNGLVNIAPVPTPLPTNTREPSPTPVPTNTLAPTNTPEPSPTPIQDLVALVNGDTPIGEDALNQLYALISGGVGVIFALIVLVIAVIILLRRDVRRRVTAGVSKTIVQTTTAVFGQQAGQAVKTAIFGAAPPADPKKPQPPTSNAPVLARLEPRQPEYGILEMRTPNFILGREITAGCHECVKNPYVSSRHLQIEMTNKGFFVTDYSSQGTFIDGVRIPQGRAAQITDGAWLGVGPQIEFIFRVDNSALKPTEIFTPGAAIPGEIPTEAAPYTPPHEDDSSAARNVPAMQDYYAAMGQTAETPIDDNASPDEPSRFGRPVDVRSTFDSMPSVPPKRTPENGGTPPTSAGDVDDDWFKQ
ncbi:MAG: FHA domain-containing protein [bacterium]|nr:FHA domain-containing protein [bacterium]